MLPTTWTSLLLILNVGQIKGDIEDVPKSNALKHRDGKVFSFFNVVRFPNAPCIGSQRNGTCYSQEECLQRSGTAQGSCAGGYGVCCISQLSCGETSRENGTYLVQTPTMNNVLTSCVYTICPTNNEICRIRYDFLGLVLADPVPGMAVAAGAAINTGHALGSCLADAFSVSSSQSASPIICGDNTGYHMILDSNGEDCQKATFKLSANAGAKRWDIRVTQYNCGSEDKAGPPGCLQYFTGRAGRITNFAWPPEADNQMAPTAAAITHLKNQRYEACFRRERGSCYICFSPTIVGANTAGITQTSFGLSKTTNVAQPQAQGELDANCATDFIRIPGAQTKAMAMLNMNIIPGTVSKLCGRFFNSQANLAAQAIVTATVCSRSYPFRLGVVFNDDEVDMGAANSMVNEQAMFPGGILGFSLDWFQESC